MRHFRRRLSVLCLFLLTGLGGTGCVHDFLVCPTILPEQRTIDMHDPNALPKARIPDVPPPPTVSEPHPDAPEQKITLEDAIRIAVANSQVVRVLAGTTAINSGSTIYDVAITNTTIDQEQGRFDPKADVANTFNRTETPAALFDPFDPNGARISGLRTDNYHLSAGLSKTTLAGGVATLSFVDDVNRFQPGVFPLNPQSRYATTLDFVQPLLQGGGQAANLAPVVIARINTERSYFQFKDSVQEMVRGVIEAYWQLKFAHADVAARRTQVEQGQKTLDFTAARQKIGLEKVTIADVAQARSALANSKSFLVGAEANLLQREAALRNILGLPPTNGGRLTPTSEPTTVEKRVIWDEMIRLAEERRPDLIELKLILEADQQNLILANNRALPRLDFVSQYRWNGLEGTTPARTHLGTRAGEFTDWTLGVNFSVPLGLRQGRAALRQQELVIQRDKANLDQGLHAAVHQLAASTRNLSQFYEQYRALKEAREAAEANLLQQRAAVLAGRQTIFLNLLQAITDLGNATSAEAQAVALYNTEMAVLERQTGTILETHGIHFYEERFGAIGPLGRLAAPRPYPLSLVPAVDPAAVTPLPTGTNPGKQGPKAVLDLEEIAPVPKQLK